MAGGVGEAGPEAAVVRGGGGGWARVGSLARPRDHVASVALPRTWASLVTATCREDGDGD